MPVCPDNPGILSASYKNFVRIIQERCPDDSSIIKLFTASPDEHPLDSSPHIVYDANLKKGGKLHRFENKAGIPYSAIYLGSREMFSCERADKKNMILTWNESF